MTLVPGIFNSDYAATSMATVRRPPAATAPADILHLAELVPVVRARFGLADSFVDDAILASLKTIAAHGAARERWRAAFSSNLGQTLARDGRDLATTLNTLLSLLPGPTS